MVKTGLLSIWISRVISKNSCVQKIFQLSYQIKLISEFFSIMYFYIHTDFVLSEIHSMENPTSIKNSLPLSF